MNGIKFLASMLACALTLLVGSCTALYAFNSSEENLPCGPDDANGSPRCKDGFVCVQADDGIERCLVAGFKEEGDACLDSGECKDGGICADIYAERCDGDVIAPEFELDCALRDSNDAGLRCRRPCKDDLTCGADLRCFDVGGVGNFCQQGTCAGDNDCVAGVQSGLCIQEGLNGGRSGLCRKECDPLSCNGGAGVCPCADDENCATPPDDGFVSARAVCLPAGVIEAGFTCDAGNFCASGATCVPIGNVEACLQWCRVGGGGAPACDAGTCGGVDPVDAALGVCQ